MRTLSEDEKIAQLIMVRMSTIDSKTRTVTFFDSTVESDIRKYNIGGICLFQGSPVRQANIVNKLQSIAKTPIMFAIDAETGLGMRMDSVPSLPRMMMLGALQDKSLVYKYGQWVGEQCRLAGIQVNFAPVADVNNNPNNPVINDRSFGENKFKVADMAVAYMLGMKSQGVMGSAKHFPGHGDVDVDSHLALPVINKTKNSLESLELYPFKKLFEAGVGSTMVAHLFIPSLDSSANRASSISPAVVNGLLKNEMGFKGITFTDALEMKGVSSAFPDGAASVESLIAGNDILCLPGDVTNVINKIKEAIQNKRLNWEDINGHVIKVLEAKYEQGLNTWTPVVIDGLTERINKNSDALRREITEKSITLAQYNDKQALPLKENRASNIALLEIGKNKNSVFASEMRRAYNADVFMFDNTMDAHASDSIANSIRSNYKQVIIALHELPRFPANNFNISAAAAGLINNISASISSNLIIFGNPYAAKSFCSSKNILIGYDDEAITQEVAAQILTGKISPEGKLPVTVCENLVAGAGETGKRGNGETESQVNVNKQITDIRINAIDSIINDAIARKAAPGMSLLVVKDGNIILQKQYGYMKYDKKEPMTNESVFDMASVTKICATTISIMKLYDEKKIDLDKTIGDYVPWIRGSNKEGIKLREILLHQAGLKAFIPFYKEITDTSTHAGLPTYFSKTESKEFGIKMGDSLFMRNEWRDTMYSRIYTSTVSPKKEYIYSDNDFIFLGEVVKYVSGQPLEQYVWNNFYRPMGFRSSGFNPTNFISKKNIVPTEEDPIFQKRVIQGFVHDPGAAMFGGVAGHAGLFSNALELATIMQMVMNNGELNGKKYISSSTIALFTKYNSDISRRGLGFDKPEKDNKTRKIAYPNISISDAAFGHTGFTGTCVWADPEKKIVIVLLANRVHPHATSTFGDLNVRGKVMEEIIKEKK